MERFEDYTDAAYERDVIELGERAAEFFFLFADDLAVLALVA